MTDLIDELAADVAALSTEAPRRPGPTCTVGKAKSRLRQKYGADPARKELLVKLFAMVEDASVDAVRVAQVLGRHSGLEVSAPTVRRHRARAHGGGCKCPIEVEG